MSAKGTQHRDCEREAEGAQSSVTQALGSAAIERDTPAEVLAIVRAIEAEEQQKAKLWAEAGLEPSKLDAGIETWWNLERAWTRWAGRQTNERLAEIIRAIAAWYNPQSENRALLVEAAVRLTKERQKNKQQRNQVTKKNMNRQAAEGRWRQRRHATQ